MVLALARLFGYDSGDLILLPSPGWAIKNAMQPIDYAIVVVYVLGCTAIGTYFGSGTRELKGYFLGGHSIPAWAVMISIVATETSTATFLSVPSIAFRGDLTYLQLPLGYLLGRVIVAVVLLPAYFRGEIFTAYQLLKDRFGGATRTTASVVFLITRVLADGIRLFLAATVLAVITHWDIGWAIVAVGMTTIVYTYLGGMKAVIWIDVIQFQIYIIGAIIALLILIGKLPGGWDELWHNPAIATKFRVFDFQWNAAKPFTFWAGLFGGMVLNTATHGADQLMVQRYLAARSERQAAGALIASGFVVLAQFALFLFIGVALFVLLPGLSAPRPEREPAQGSGVRLLHREQPPARDSRRGCGGHLLGGDGDGLGVAQRLGVDDGQRPDTGPCFPDTDERSVTLDLEGVDGNLGDRSDGGGVPGDAAQK